MKNRKLKIFNQNLNKNSKTIVLKKSIGDTGRMKYFPSFAKEWNNTIYSFNQNSLKNIPANDITINKIIKSYFNLYFKDPSFLESKITNSPLKRKRGFLRRIYVSNAEIKHTNNKAIITLYTFNREKNVLKRNYIEEQKKMVNYYNKLYFFNYSQTINKIYNLLSNKSKNKDVQLGLYNTDITLISENTGLVNKRKFLMHKFKYLNEFITLKNLYLKKYLAICLTTYFVSEKLLTLRKEDLLYSLNKSKFSKLTLLPLLSNMLTKIIGKKIEYNIINLKSITLHTDLFTNALALKLRKKRRYSALKSIYSIIRRASFPTVNRIMERSRIKGSYNQFNTLNRHENLNLVSNVHINVKSPLDQWLASEYPNKQIHNLIYDSIGYKNMAGIRLQAKGRLTKRYRADRSVYVLKWKGGLKNIDSSFKGLSSVLFRGNSNSNVSYSLAKSKRRVGAFAVKGWMAGK